MELSGVSRIPGINVDPTSVPMIEAAPAGALSVPYRSQLDGSPQARANCGPASLGMLMAHLGNGTSIADLRWSINTTMGRWHVTNGSSWDALARAAESRGLRGVGLYSAPRTLRKWTVDDLRVEIGHGYPVMVLTRYKHLPGREDSRVQYNHYVVVVGIAPDGTVYHHDPAYLDASSGAYRTITPQQFEVAWSSVSTGVNFSGMALRPSG
jgi:hypothetical protein